MVIFRCMSCRCCFEALFGTRKSFFKDVSKSIMQIIAEGKAKPKFVSLSSSILGKGSWFDELSYLHSPESKLLLG